MSKLLAFGQQLGSRNNHLLLQVIKKRAYVNTLRRERISLFRNSSDVRPASFLGDNRQRVLSLLAARDRRRRRLSRFFARVLKQAMCYVNVTTVRQGAKS